jgi:hypothetical protein
LLDCCCGSLKVNWSLVLLGGALVKFLNSVDLDSELLKCNSSNESFKYRTVKVLPT